MRVDSGVDRRKSCAGLPLAISGRRWRRRMDRRMARASIAEFLIGRARREMCGVICTGSRFHRSCRPRSGKGYVVGPPHHFAALATAWQVPPLRSAAGSVPFSRAVSPEPPLAPAGHHARAAGTRFNWSWRPCPDLHRSLCGDNAVSCSLDDRGTHGKTERDRLDATPAEVITLGRESAPPDCLLHHPASMPCGTSPRFAADQPWARACEPVPGC